MGEFINGEWKEGWYKNDEEGKFKRPPTTFRKTLEEFEPGRYHLYVSWACPWAHRTLIARSLLGLTDQISVSYVDWYLDDGGWRFHPEHEGSTRDHLYDFDRLRHLYKKADEHYTGRVTVPILWDIKESAIINNESREILRSFTTRLRDWHRPGAPDLCPAELTDEIDQTLDAIYEPINNGVYKAGFATSQPSYEQAVDTLFAALDSWERRLERQKFLVGDRLTEADICLFTTTLRFDPVYFVHFKCSKRMICQYPNLSAHLERVYNTPGVKETCHMDHIRNHYYQSHKKVNPSGVVAAVPLSAGPRLFSHP
ncbi:MAG: glutathione S-transferase C-terminal domain-containing protein [Vulcanimicrobiota bacterium]